MLDPSGLKLNDRKVQWIISQKEKRVSSSEIARSMHVTVQYVNRIWKNYREIGKRTLREKGPPQS